MEQKIDRLIDKVDKIEDTLVKQEVNLARLTVSVEEHVKRSNNLEEALKPVQRHVVLVEGALKFIGLLGVLATIVETFLWMRH
jgi:hypothetical protein